MCTAVSGGFRVVAAICGLFVGSFPEHGVLVKLGSVVLSDSAGGTFHHQLAAAATTAARSCAR